MIEISLRVRQRFPEIYLSTKLVENVRVKASQRLKELSENLRRSFAYTLETLRGHPLIRAYRDFYWRIGVDPTKQRPASEALVRRLLSGSGLPEINNVVDAGNLASAETLIPMGLYDYDKIRGRPILRFARSGETFIDLTGKKRRLGSNMLVLADEEGLIHIFPYRDAERTKITNSTTRVLAVGCGVPGVPKEIVDRACKRFLHYLEIL